MRPNQTLLLISTFGYPNGSTNSETTNNLKKQGRVNMENESIFATRAPLRDLLSIVQCEHWYYCERELLFFSCLRMNAFCPKLLSKNEVVGSRDQRCVVFFLFFFIVLEFRLHDFLNIHSARIALDEVLLTLTEQVCFLYSSTDNSA